MKTWQLVVALALVATACGDTTATTVVAPTSAAATTAAPPVTTSPAPPVAPPTTASATTAPATTAPATTVAPPIAVAIDFYEGQVSGPGRFEVNKGDEVEIVVTSDVADEVHIHGYDLLADVAAGGTVSIAFEATIQGIFEVEMEGARAPLLELVVN